MLIDNTIYGIQNLENAPEQKIASFNLLMEKFNDLKGIINEKDTVLIKPNFVAPSSAATTDLVLLECMIKSVIECGAVPIIGESSGYEFSTAGTFKILGIDELCKKYNVELINFDNEKFVEVQTQNPYVPVYLIPEIVTTVDKIIDMPCLKGHSLTKVTFGIKNLFGILHRNTRRDIHATDLELGISELAKLFHVDFVLVDGLWNLVNAVYSNSFYQGILIAGTDLVSVDRICCNIFGVSPSDIPHIAQAGPEKECTFIELSPIQRSDNKVNERVKHFKKQNIKYKTIYRLERIIAKIFRISIIPYIHFYLRIRPYIDAEKCNGCEKCYKVCPVNAIHDKRIDTKKCMKIRCFKCFEVCDQNAVIKKGFHKS